MKRQTEPVVIGVDIGGTKIIAGIVTESGDILHTEQVATPSTPSDILSCIQTLCHALADGVSVPLVGIGIGTAGIVDASTGIVIHANENLSGWTNTALANIPLSQTLPITVDNDVRAMAYAEAVLGAGREFNSVLCVTVGTGIGGGLIVDGEIYHGATYSAGEIGYLVVGWDDNQPILFDQFSSGPAIERTYQVLSDANERLPLTEISRLAQNNATIAFQVIQQKATEFGHILGGYVTSINPEAVVIGGGVPQIGACWWDAMQTAFYESVPPPVKSTKLLLSSLGIEAVMLGAAMLVWKRIAS